MEELLHYVWQHRIFPTASLYTSTGKEVEVIDPGLHNADAGPDFFNAKIRIDGLLWVGNVEIHLKSSDWYKHHHERNGSYNNVILHVVKKIDCEVETSSKRALPQVELRIPQEIESHYQELMAENNYPPCYRVIAQIPIFHIHHWINNLALERLEMKTERIEKHLQATAGDWEWAFFITVARAFGFGKNTDALECWCRTMHPRQIGKHRDNALQMEALFLGQAGLLEKSTVASEQRDSHFEELQREYNFLKQKFDFQHLDPKIWKFLRLRPQNFPHVRLAQLAAWYMAHPNALAEARESKSIEEARQCFHFNSPPYWQNHYRWGSTHSSTQPQRLTNRKKKEKGTLSQAMTDLLIINALIPVLFAFGKEHNDHHLTQKVFDWLELLPPEKNTILKTWSNCGITARSAADSQALLQLQHNYCERKDCIRCKFGAYYLRQKNDKH